MTAAPPARGSALRIPMMSVEEARAIAAREGLPAIMAPLSVFRVLLHHPALARSLGGLLKMLLLEGNHLDGRLRELIIMRIGWLTGSNYEWTQHWRFARDMGIPENVLLACRSWESATVLSAADRAILRATDETMDTGRISESTWAECERHVTSIQARLELVVAIGNWRTFSQLLLTLGIPLEDGLDNWMPDGVRPARAPADF
ncbi:carboxymuconolactone decarboxylase family protein [Nevskia sp.]|uniref:carboxymuconolactone decarboxylase family protein n=1 Tax=Nevskia sp. TaxID=1929292 RepID=UPI0025EF7D9C|nr:carboxymuconolactone decarboxylase family protein [Nevskia sp.]